MSPSTQQSVISLATKSVEMLQKAGKLTSANLTALTNWLRDDYQARTLGDLVDYIHAL